MVHVGRLETDTKTSLRGVWLLEMNLTADNPGSGWFTALADARQHDIEHDAGT